MSRKLASIQEIIAIRDVAGTDKLQVATVLGWNVIINKDNGYKVGDWVIYIETDSRVPETEAFEFMRKKDFKVKLMKMRGEYSQGLLMPLTMLPTSEWELDKDVTDAMGIYQFNAPEAPKPIKGKTTEKRRYRYEWMPQTIMRWLYQHWFWMYWKLTSAIGSNFPYFVPKTDETRVQVLQPMLTAYKGTECYVTEKLDGQSFTAYVRKGKFGVCSRNVDLDINSEHDHVLQAKVMQVEKALRDVPVGEWAIQGELVGPGIQGNKLKLKERTIYFYNVFDIGAQRYLDFIPFTVFIDKIGYKCVPVLDSCYTLDDNIDDIVKLAVGKSVFDSSVQREGIVIRPLIDTIDYTQAGMVRGRISFKAINPEWLLAYKE